MRLPKQTTVLLFLPGSNGAMSATFQARTGCRPQNRLGMQKGIAEIYVTGSSYGGRIFWSDMLAASGSGSVARNEYAPLLLALKWTMGAYVRAFDTCGKCRSKR